MFSLLTKYTLMTKVEGVSVPITMGDGKGVSVSAGVGELAMISGVSLAKKKSVETAGSVGGEPAGLVKLGRLLMAMVSSVMPEKKNIPPNEKE